MYFSVIIILAALIIAYLWAARGFFSALLHMAAVIAAGAIAFSVWEPAAMLLLGTGDSGWIGDAAWGVGLAGPFIVCLLAIRVTLDKTIRANVDLDAAANLVGGAVCGAVSATLSLGIMVLSISALRLPTDLKMGWAPIGYDNQGSLTRADGTHSLLFPVDRITAGFYSMMSESAFRPFNSSDTLARWHPSLADEGAMLRINYGEGSSKHVIRPDRKAFEVVGRYTVGRAQNDKDINKDTIDTNPQPVTAPDGTSIGGNACIEAFIVKFGPNAREKLGGQQVIVGNSQLRLIVEPVDGPASKTMALHPMAVISKARPDEPPPNAGPNWKPPPAAFGRWRFNTRETFIASVGGDNEALMAFEFLVPKDHRPIALYVKGVRVEVPPTGGRDFKNVAERDKEIKNGKLVEGSGGTFDIRKASKKGMVVYRINNASAEQHVRGSTALPYNIVLQKDDLQGIEIEARGQDNYIVGGRGRFTKQMLQATKGIDRKLQVRRFGASDDTGIVYLTVDKANTEFGFLATVSQGVDRAAAPVLIDSNSNIYTPVGYVYQDNQGVDVKFEPGSPITSINDLPTLSTSRPDQEMTLIYRVTRGVRLQYFAVGEKVIAEFKPVLDVKGQ